MLFTLKEVDEFDDSRMIDTAHYLHLFQDIRSLLPVD